MERRYGLDCISYLTDITIERVPNKGESANATVRNPSEVRRFMPEQSDVVKAIERKEREIERLRELLRMTATSA
jgi:hypothetical protein